VLLLISVAQLMVILDATVVNVALPSVGRALELDQSSLAWVVNAYTLIFGGFLLLGGRAADLLGRRRVFLVGLVIFSAASLVGGLAQNEATLIIARGVQGLGGAIISPAALSILTVTFAEGSERNRALGIWGAIAGGGAAVGLLLGGLLTEYVGWRWCFFVNVPVGIVAVLAIPRILAESRIDAATRNYDAAGAVTATAGLVLLVYATVSASEEGWGSTQTLACFAAAAVLLALFLLIEARLAAEPLVPLGVFRNRTLSGANLVMLLVGLGLFGVFFFLSLYMQQVLGYSALRAGVSYLPLTAVIIVSSGLASFLMGRVGVKPLMIIGLIVASAGLYLFSRISVEGDYPTEILPAMLVMAAGMGFVFVPGTTAAVAGVEPAIAGLASALVNTAQQIGGALGLAILTYVATTRTQDVMAGAGQPSPEALVEGFQRAFLYSGSFVLAGVAFAILMIRGGIEAPKPGEPVAAYGD
jgi:EmrB/QacA subfamily drug resistance transporter